MRTFIYICGMAKTANLYARIEPEIKEEAENILDALGIPVSNAINMFYKQIILQQGLPFDVKLPRPADASKMSAEEISRELDKGYADYRSGRTTPAAAFFSDIKAKYKV